MRINDFFYSPRFWIARHTLFWLFFYLDEFLSFLGMTEPIMLNGFLLSFGLDLAMVYFNLYYLIPKLFNRKKLSLYLGLTVLTVLVNTFLVNYLFFDPTDYGSNYDIFYDVLYVLISTSSLLGMAVAIKISKINFTKQEEMRALEGIKHIAEVDNLKKQINPHFLFNILNNMYVQSKESPKDLPDTILKLSDLMRYQTYDASKQQVPLKKEIHFINQYIDFEKMRRENLEVSLTTEGNLQQFNFAPLLFLPFIENACKHSSDTEDRQTWIKLSWKELDGKLQFHCSNSVGTRSGFVNDQEYSGFGLENVKKRLDLLFPEKYNLEIDEQNDTFSVKLSLEA